MNKRVPPSMPSNPFAVSVKPKTAPTSSPIEDLHWEKRILKISKYTPALCVDDTGMFTNVAMISHMVLPTSEENIPTISSPGLSA